MIEIDVNQTIYSLVKEYPLIKEIMVELGFKDIVKPGLLQSVGRMMTIEKGCSMRGLNLDEVKKNFLDKGFKLT